MSNWFFREEALSGRIHPLFLLVQFKLLIVLHNLLNWIFGDFEISISQIRLGGIVARCRPVALSWHWQFVLLWLFCHRPCSILLSLTIRTCHGDSASRFRMVLNLRLRQYHYHLLFLVYVFTASSTLSHLVELSLISVVYLLKLIYIIL